MFDMISVSKTINNISIHWQRRLAHPVDINIYSYGNAI